MKTCTKCGEEKVLEDFYRSKDKPDGRKAWCRQCHLDHYNPEKDRERKIKLRYGISAAEFDMQKAVAAQEWQEKWQHGIKQCLACKKDLPLLEFSYNARTKDELHYYCRKCNNEMRRKNLLKRKEESPEDIRKTERRARLKWKFKLTETDFDAMLARQGGVCGICKRGTPGGRGTFHIDHDHACCPGEKSCGKCIRGLLCGKCNNGLGIFYDDPETLRNAADYLEKWKANAPDYA